MQLPEHCTAMGQVPLRQSNTVPNQGTKSITFGSETTCAHHMGSQLWRFQLQGQFFVLQSNPCPEWWCKYLLASWHLFLLAGHPLCFVCCGSDAETAASCSGDEDGCCSHRESFSTNNKTRPTPAEMQTSLVSWVLFPSDLQNTSCLVNLSIIYNFQT